MQLLSFGFKQGKTVDSFRKKARSAFTYSDCFRSSQENEGVESFSHNM